jgi:hypothetical protein
MPSAEAPVQIIKDFISLFGLDWFVGDSVREGRITPTSFGEKILLHGDAWSVDLSKIYTP